ncbi:hypothetical protein [Pseudolactococcus reticulitermitis]|uniref:Uncharacterized protein n=1 Tax=Pseudolactococcus reticulitermitis TaxID=2025039 RepID=A0A224X1I5_9LACT|nr:hypothetical protein [Lactococcus reticulitermitis]GAX48069.1 hypothetical protein RsY01_1683 [Lactococcus reticulitermitis]GHU37062.1 hypothetical protein FACS1894192_05060 [Bacilli bacterium]GHU39983.1 hypothetical protein FACS1894193_01500 [Bacilli bacterium]
MLQKWGWAFISLALLIFISTLQGKGVFLIVSILLFALGLGMVIVGGKKDKSDQNGEPK